MKKCKKKTKWRPVHGQASTNFSVMGLAYNADEIPEELSNFAKSLEFTSNVATYFNPEFLNDPENENVITLEATKDPISTWNEIKDPIINEKAKKACKEVLPRLNKNLKFTARHTLDNKGSYTLTPFWFAYYNYNGGKYYYIMDGEGKAQKNFAPVHKGVKFFLISFLFVPILVALPLFFNDKAKEGIVVVVSLYLARWIYKFIRKRQRISAAKKAFPESNYVKSL